MKVLKNIKNMIIVMNRDILALERLCLLSHKLGKIQLRCDVYHITKSKNREYVLFKTIDVI